MGSVHTSSAVQTKDYKISICCFSAKHAALRRKNQDFQVLIVENELIHVSSTIGLTRE
jgi:type IV secretory pathway VirB4 component